MWLLARVLRLVEPANKYVYGQWVLINWEACMWRSYVLLCRKWTVTTNKKLWRTNGKKIINLNNHLRFFLKIQKTSTTIQHEKNKFSELEWSQKKKRVRSVKGLGLESSWTHLFLSTKLKICEDMEIARIWTWNLEGQICKETSEVTCLCSNLFF